MVKGETFEGKSEKQKVVCHGKMPGGKKFALNWRQKAGVAGAQ